MGIVGSRIKDSLSQKHQAGYVLEPCHTSSLCRFDRGVKAEQDMTIQSCNANDYTDTDADQEVVLDRDT